MADLSARPEPLRVPVGEVLARTSLLTPMPPTMEPAATLTVVQRAVRIISDPPPPMPGFASATLIDELKLGLEGVTTHEFEAAIEGAFAAELSDDNLPSTAPPALDSLPDVLVRNDFEQAGDAHGTEPLSPIASIADAIDAALADASALRDDSERPEEEPIAEDGPAALDDLSHVAAAHHDAGVEASAYDERRAEAVAEAVSESPASAEVSIDIDIAPDDFSGIRPRDAEPALQQRTESYVDELSEDALTDALSDAAQTPKPRPSMGLDGPTVPPPAPPEALRRSIPLESQQTTPRASVPGRVGGKERPSGEFEELDVEAVAEMRAVQEARASRTNGPPPPPPTRNLAPEPEPSPAARPPRVEDVRPSRPRAQAWWEQFFDDDYLRTVRPPSREQVSRQVDFVERRLGLKPGAAVLDVGCGLGLQVLELNTRGYVGVGLDLSLPMLTRAAEEAQARPVRVNFLHGDMREMVFDAAFDAVVCLGTTFGYFDDDNNKKVLERLYRALKPGGALLIDVVNRDHVLSSQPNLVWFEGDGCVCMEETELNYFTSRLHVKRTVIHDTGKQTENEYGLRLYSLHELGQLLNATGFRVVEVSGRETVPGVFFGQESPNLLIVAQRRVAPEAPAVPNADA